MAKVLGIIAIIILSAAAGAGALFGFSGPPSVQLRWKNADEVKPVPDPIYKELVDRDNSHHWESPTVTVYSAPYSAPHPSPLTLKDLSDNGQAHAIDFVFKAPPGPRTAWQELISTIGGSSGEPDRVDPYRADRVLIATVVKGLDTLPGDRLLWTRVFVQPINFEFAGYTVAATDSKSIKIASIESSSNAKLSITGAAEAGVAKPDVGQEFERTQKATADINEQYENLGIDIQPRFLRIIRESAPGGDVAGNTAIQLSMVTDPSRIWCDEVGENCPPKPSKRPPQKTKDEKEVDDRLVLLVSSAHLSDGETNPRISVLPQAALPHCPLKAKVWMLYQIRHIKRGRQKVVSPVMV